MTDGKEECDLQQLVLMDDDPLTTKYGEVTPPVSPGISKNTQTSPTSPESNKVRLFSKCYALCFFSVFTALKKNNIYGKKLRLQYDNLRKGSQLHFGVRNTFVVL